jgi:low temperature requirement protein LtrA
MRGRPADEEHRASTALELFFDLCFVVAVAQAAAGLHHDLSENHVGHGVTGYLMVFFAIWWAWMNFTWFASAYDCDDGPYRLATFVQITGALVLAAGVPRAFADSDYTVVVAGYVLMRLAGVAQWLRAAASDPDRRRTAVRYAIGVAAVQVAWVARLALPERWLLPGFLLLIAAELLVPIWAERGAPTSWHPRHIAERYGLFTIIVLGESVLSATLAIQSSLDAGHQAAGLISLAGAGAVIMFSIWWLYFEQPAHELLTSLRRAFLWGYGHYFLFASVAAVGAALAVAVDHEIHIGHLPAIGVGYAIAVPVAVFLSGVWALHIRLGRPGPLTPAFLVTTVLVLAAPLTPLPVHTTALLLAALVAATVLLPRPRPEASIVDPASPGSALRARRE